MKFRKNYGEFLNEQNSVNEDHIEDRQAQIDYIIQNATAAGYPDLENDDVLASMSDVGVNAVYNMIEQILKFNDVRESADMFLSEKSDHEGWVVVGLDKDSKKFEILSIPLIRKEAVRFLQSFEVQMSKMADKMKKYTKLKLAHASDVFEGAEFEIDGVSYTGTGEINEEYVESMNHIELANAMGIIKTKWDEWKNGPLTEPSDIKPAKKELISWVTRFLKQNIK